MRILEVSIKNYKSLNSLTLEPRDLMVLVGPNNSGKSSVLQALRVPQALVGRVPLPVNAIDMITNRSPGGTISIDLKVQFTPQEIKSMADIFHDYSETYLFRFEIPHSANRTLVIPTRIYSSKNQAIQIWERSGYGPNSSLIFSHLQAQNARGSVQIQPDQALSRIQNWMSQPLGSNDRFIALDPLRILVNKLFYYDHHRAISDNVSIGSDVELSSSGSTLAAILAIWKLNDDPKFSEFATLIDKMVPHLGKLTVPPTGGSNVSIVFQKTTSDGIVPINATAMGTGIQQLLALTYHLVSREKNVLLLEEPEVHLHPSGQKALAQAIKAASRWAQVLLSTHSPLFVDRINYDNNIVLRLDDSGFTQAETLNRTNPMRRVRDILGVSLADNLYIGEAVVLVEGTTEQVCLPLLADKMLNDNEKQLIDWNRIAIINMGGAGNMESILKLVLSFKVPVITILDGDSAGRRAANICYRLGLDENSVILLDLKRLDCAYTFEDTLPLGQYLEGVAQIYDIAISEKDYGKIEGELKEQYKGHSPTRSRVIKELLVFHEILADFQDEYDKVAVALKTIDLMSVEDVPPIFSVVFERIQDLWNNK